jgi:diaminohydroxyphosphoribosylaminopyrimidine deaminase/5-amino-6-(5-phosphoribosylamino)uracil reductase
MQIVGEGWHEHAGGPHAEVVALREAGSAAAGATVYVTLEPCAHFGRTPPCADALVAAGVARVVVASPDPDPRVAGAGVARLRAGGVAVVEGVLQRDADALNAAYLVHRREGRPWVRYKTAMTLDGKIATRTGRSRWITGPAARALVHGWRHRADAVAVGVSTLLQDDPALTTRLESPDGPGRTPRKVVFDGVARTPVTARAFEPGPDGQPARVTIVVGPDAPAARVAALEARGAEVLRVAARQGRPDVAEALRTLATDGVVELLLEGGGTLAWSFLEAGAIDRVAWFVAPKLIGGRGASPLAGLGVATLDEAYALSDWSVERLGDDLLIEGDLVRPGPVEER